MRSQWCREHIDETAKNCGLGADTVSDVKKAAKFCVDHPEISDCSTHAIMALIDVRDDLVRDKAISSIEKSLESGKHPLTGQIIKDRKLTERDIKKVIDQSFRELHTEPPRKPAPYNGTPQKDDFKDVPSAPIAQSLKEKYAPVQNPPPSIEKLPCQEGKPCPAGRNYLINQPTLGDKCVLTGSLIRNMTVCPVIQRQKAAEINGSIFATGGQIKAMVDRAPAGIPRVSQNQPQTLTIKFTARQWAVLKQIVREERADTLEDAVLFLVNEAGERMDGA